MEAEEKYWCGLAGKIVPNSVCQRPGIFFFYIIFLFSFSFTGPQLVPSPQTLCALEGCAGHTAPACGLASHPHISVCDEYHKESNDWFFPVNKRAKKNECTMLLWQTTSTDTQPAPFYRTKQKCLKKGGTHRCSFMKSCKRETLEEFLSPPASSAVYSLASDYRLAAERCFHWERSQQADWVGSYPVNKCQIQQSSKEEIF